MNPHRKSLARGVAGLGLVLPVWLWFAPTALAQETPYQRYELMWSGWMAAGFITFVTVAIGCFVVAVKWGILHDLEEPKYYMLTIDEPDYYSPDWDKEERNAASHSTGNE